MNMSMMDAIEEEYEEKIKKLQERIKELEDYLLEFGGHKNHCLANIAKEHCNCGFEEALN